MDAISLLSSALSVVLLGGLGYIGLLATLTIPAVQTHVIYLYRITLTWFQDVNEPMQWGFLPNQVTPFFIETPDKERLHAWHILPIGLYQQHESELVAEPSGLAANITQRLSFKLLRDDPQSLLVLYFHGAAGTLGSGWRPPSYRAMHALAPMRIHTIAIDYRGFGQSTGYPTEQGILTDALTLVKWATAEAKIPPNRIVVFAQSLGTAIALSMLNHLATSPEPVFFKGIVLVAPFADAAELTNTYSIAGTIPLLGPLAKFPILHKFFQSFLICKWPSKEYLANLLQTAERTKDARFNITILHAKDDWDIPWSHSDILFWYAVEANAQSQTEFKDTRGRILGDKRLLGLGGWMLERRTSHGILRQQIVEHGLHDRIMSYPQVSLAVWTAFHDGAR